MRYRVEELAARAELSVDTVRFYQSRGLLPPPRREGRRAWYDDDHLGRLAEIRQRQGQGLSLALIGRLLNEELDAADEALARAVSAGELADHPPLDPGRQPFERSSEPPGPAEEFLTLEELAERSRIPVALLEAVEREGLLVPRRHRGQPRYTAADVAVAAAGLRLLEVGLPLAEVLDLARRHHTAMRAVAERAVELFDSHVRRPLRDRDLSEEEAAGRLVEAFEVLLPATITLVTHHFRRTLLAVAREHIERVGVDAERQAVEAAAEAGAEARA